LPVSANLYYQLYQKGEAGGIPLVLIHGAGGTHLYWPPQVRRLAGRQVYALDLPGHGKSPGEGCATIAAYAGRVRDWLEAVSLRKVILAGHSMGSAISLALALDSPECVLGLALLGAAARLRVNPAILEKVARSESFLEAIDQITAWSYSPATPQPLVRLAAQRMAEIRLDVLYGDFLACDSFDSSARLVEISQPVRVLCGEEDRMTPLRQSQALVAKIPGARLEVIPHAGHMVMIEQPEATAASLADFIESCQIHPPLV
jgi:pimeloyl-ACP methyl ester carboxylesterase